MPIIQHKSQRVAIFIDTQNLYHSARHMYERKVNFPEIVKQAVGKRDLIRAFAYAITTEAGDEAAFLEALENNGIEVCSKDLQIFTGGAKKGDWDVGLAVDAIKMSAKVDVVVIVSGDGDFIPLVEYLQYNGGCRVEVISFRRSSSAKLIEAVDHFTDLDEDPDKYLLGSRTKKKGRGSKQKKTGRKQTKKPETESSAKKAPIDTEGGVY